MARKRDIFTEFSTRYGMPGRVPVRRPAKKSNWERGIIREFWK